MQQRMRRTCCVRACSRNSSRRRLPAREKNWSWLRSTATSAVGNARKSNSCCGRHPMTDLLPMLVPLLGRALLDFVWQGALIGLGAGVVLAAMGNARPNARYAVGCLALLACALAPVIDVVLLLADQSTPAFATTARAPFVDMATVATTALPAV